MTTDLRSLPWRVLRRTIRPYALAVSLATAVLFASMLTASGVGDDLDGVAGKAIVERWLKKNEDKKEHADED